MNVQEIARALFKPRWADAKEFARALRALDRLDEDGQIEVREYALRRGWRVE